MVSTTELSRSSLLEAITAWDIASMIERAESRDWSTFSWSVHLSYQSRHPIFSKEKKGLQDRLRSLRAFPPCHRRLFFTVTGKCLYVVLLWQISQGTLRLLPSSLSVYAIASKNRAIIFATTLYLALFGYVFSYALLNLCPRPKLSPLKELPCWLVRS